MPCQLIWPSKPPLASFPGTFIGFFTRMSSHMSLEMRTFRIHFFTAWMFAMVNASTLEFRRASSMRQDHCWRGIWRWRAEGSKINLLGDHLWRSRVRIRWRWWVNNSVVAWRLSDFKLMVVWSIVTCYGHIATNSRHWADGCDCWSGRKRWSKCECVHICDENLLWHQR